MTIMNNQGNINNQDNSGEGLNKSPLQLYIESRESDWLKIITDLNTRMKKIENLPDIQGELFVQRQICVDYYYKVLRMISEQQKQYRPKYAAKYNDYKMRSQIRYNSDAAINAQIQSDLSGLLCDIELMNNHGKYMQETLRTLDDMIYSINNRIQLEKLIKNYDF